MARPEGLEPSTYRLTAGRSTIELRANKSLLHIYYNKSKFICKLFFNLIFFSAVLLKQLDHVFITLHRGIIQGRMSICIGQIGICSALEHILQ